MFLNDRFSFLSGECNDVTCLYGHLVMIATESAILVYNIGTRTIEELPLPLPLRLSKLFVSKGRCYGIVENHRDQMISLQEYEVEQRKLHLISQLPHQVEFKSIQVAVSDELVCVIGCTSENNCSRDIIQCYNLQLKQWADSASRSHTVCTVAMNKSIIYIADQQNHHIESIPLSTGSLPVPPVPLAFTSDYKLLAIHQQLLCIGDDCSSVYVLYHPTMGGPNWQSLISIPSKLTSVKACAINATSVLIMGTSTSQSSIKQVELYSLSWN